MQMRHHAAAFALAACAASPARDTTPIAPAMAAELDATIAHAMIRLPVIPGLAVAAYTREGVYVRGFGVTDADTGERVTPDTAFYIASATKPFTALAMAILEQRGELALGATLSQIAPDAPFPAAVRPDEVRLRDLLAHTSGVVNDAIGYRVAFSGQHDPSTLWGLLADTSVNSAAPRGQFAYTNVGYNLLSILTERRLGIRWQDLLQREIFTPAGMTRTSAVMSRAAAEGWSLARPHESVLANRPRRLALEKTDATMHAAGGMIMSARDAARWLDLMINDGRVGGRQVVPENAVRATRTPLAEPGKTAGVFTRDRYGLGWYLGRYRDDAMAHHSGAFAGFRSHISYLPARAVGVAVFANESEASSPLIDVIASYVYDQLAGRPDARQALDAALEQAVRDHAEHVAHVAADRARRAQRPWTLTRPRAAYAGLYEGTFGRMEIRVEGDALRVSLGVLHATAEPFTQPDSIRVQLVPPDGESIRFELADDGTPARLIFQGVRLDRRGAPEAPAR